MGFFLGAVPMNHSGLIDLAAQWLRRNHPVVVTELACVGEEPDALGFRYGYSTLIECKASRGDFLGDKRKRWRRMPETALGDWRYYCAPPGVIDISELPEGWGLLEPTRSGRGLRVVVAAALATRRGHHNEIVVLMSILRRIGQSQPTGVSIRCYTTETKNRATVSIVGAE